MHEGDKSRMNPIGAAAMVPPQATAGEWGKWTCRLDIVGPGVEAGGVIRVQLPHTWNRGVLNGSKGVHSIDPTVINYVAARCSNPDVVLACEVEEGSTDEFTVLARIGIDGRRHRHAWVASVRVHRGTIGRGDTVEVTYGAGADGNPGFRAGLHPFGAERVLVSVDRNGSGEARILDAADSPTIEVVPSRPVEILAVAPSVLGPDEDATLLLNMVDEFANLVVDFVGTASLAVRTGAATVPDRISFTAEDRGSVRVPFRPVAPGVVRVSVSVHGVPTALSNPCVVGDQAPARQLYWGDLHSHSDFSDDGIGDTPFEYARDVAALDFYALSEHSYSWEPGAWDVIRQQVRQFHDNGRFVTILAYEASFGPPYGHHNVYFRDDIGAAAVDGRGSVHELYTLLESTDAILVPHHTGIHWVTPQNLDLPGLTPVVHWEHHNPRLRRLVEIYSVHGQSETYDVKHPLAYENCDGTLSESTPGPHYATDGWAVGQILGTIGSSDDHSSQPGRGESGLAAVWSGRLDRGEIFDALRDRRTFGTTGQRMVLTFTLDGTDGPTVAWRETLVGRLSVHGTAELEAIEIFELDLDTRQPRLLERFECSALDHTTSWTAHPPRRAAYYMRVTQRGQYRGRAVMAWSTPIWVGLDDQ